MLTSLCGRCEATKSKKLPHGKLLHSLRRGALAGNAFLRLKTYFKSIFSNGESCFLTVPTLGASGGHARLLAKSSTGQVVELTFKQSKVYAALPLSRFNHGVSLGHRNCQRGDNYGSDPNP